MSIYQETIWKPLTHWDLILHLLLFYFNNSLLEYFSFWYVHLNILHYKKSTKLHRLCITYYSILRYWIGLQQMYDSNCINCHCRWIRKPSQCQTTWTKSNYPHFLDSRIKLQKLVKAVDTISNLMQCTVFDSCINENSISINCYCWHIWKPFPNKCQARWSKSNQYQLPWQMNMVINPTLTDQVQRNTNSNLRITTK